MKDCRQCEHGQTVHYKDRLCDRLPQLMTIEQARDPSRECGPEAVLFEPVGEGKQ
jgi:hypothetical protein